MVFAFDTGFLPALSADMQAFIRVMYGFLQLLTIAAALPHAARYFGSERWGGYAQSSAWVDAVQNPVVGSAVIASWICATVCLVIGRFVVAAALANLAINYYLFISMRWRGVLRGMGAPGFMFIATQIRLGFLCEMVIVCCMLFFGPATWGNRAIAGLSPLVGASAAPAGTPLPHFVQMMLVVFCWMYLALLPVARVAMYYNQLTHRRLPGPAQRTVDAYTNAFGLVIWRVCSADVISFFIRIWEQDASGRRRVVADFEGF